MIGLVFCRVRRVVKHWLKESHLKCFEPTIKCKTKFFLFLNHIPLNFQNWMRLKLRYKFQNHLQSLRAFSILLWEEKTNSFKTCNWSTNCSTYSNIWRPTKTNREWFIIIMRSLRKQPFQNNIATTKRSHMTSPNYKRVQPSTPQKSGPLMMTLLRKQRLQTDCRAVAHWVCVGVFPLSLLFSQRRKLIHN